MTEHVIADRYEVVRELARTGPRTTYLARDRTANTDVVVCQVSLGDGADAIAAVDSLAREADALRAFDHPGVPALVDYRPVELSREAMLVRAFAPGESLATRTYSDVELLAIVESVIAILADIAPKVHGALSSDRIIVDGTRVALVGFGATDPGSDLLALESLLDGRLGLRAVIDALRAPNASFRTARVAIAAARDAAAQMPSSDDIAKMRREAEAAGAREAAEQDARQAKARTKDIERRDVMPRLRITATEDADGTTVTFRRGRDAWIAVFLVPAILFLVIGLPVALVAGTIAVIVVVASFVALGALILFLTRPHRLRLTRRGDFVLYRGDPRRPIWIGRRDKLQCDIVTTMKGDKMAMLRFDGHMKHWYPVAPFEASALRSAFSLA